MTKRVDIQKFGSHMRHRGWVAIPGDSPFPHTFGGSKWSVEDPTVAVEKPTLLMVLNLADPRLVEIKDWGLDELPICSHINCNIWSGKQIYLVFPEQRTVSLCERAIDDPEVLDEEDKLPNPLPAWPFDLRPMGTADMPIDKDSYWRISDDFMGGQSFIRILGPPLWLEKVEEHKCRCGHDMQYVCSIGNNINSVHERQEKPSFFIGEGALYFHFCGQCSELLVSSQSS